MLHRSLIESELKNAIGEISLDGLGSKISGKVRDSYVVGEKRVLITSDRLSAFDVILTTIPFKGQVLNGIASYWFDETKDLVANHLLARPHPNVFIAEQVEIIPVEVVVRGYLAGSAWRDYQSTGVVSGIPLPTGMKEFQRFPEPLITPSTKAPSGTHDEPISHDEIIKRGIVSKTVWDDVCKKALALFNFGTKRARERGLIFVDTKYEFGVRIVNGSSEVVVADEIHTPDSSRYWLAESYDKHLATGSEPLMLDKEFFRRWLLEQGYSGNGTPPVIPDSKRVEIAERYIDLYEKITGREFKPETTDVERIREVTLKALG